MARYRWSLWASSDCPSWGTSLRCTNNERSPSRPGVVAVRVAWSDAEEAPSPPEISRQNGHNGGGRAWKPTVWPPVRRPALGRA